MKSNDEYLKKIDKAKYLYMLLLFLWCAYTAPFLKPFDTQYLPSSFLYIMIYGIYFYLYCQNKNILPLVSLVSIMGVWFLCQCVKVGGITSIDFRLLYSIVLCHVSFSLYKGREFFLYFEKVLFHLTILSFIVWGFGLIAPTTARAVFDSISVWSNGGTAYGNLVIVGLGNQKSMGVLRNIGFTWEAGRFSSFLVVGMFVSLILHNMRTLKNIYFMVFVAGMISTISTTGIGASAGVALLYVINQGKLKHKNAIVALLLMIFIAPLIWELQFMNEKILRSSDVQQEIQNMHYSFEHGSELITPQRITGLYLEYHNLVHDYWFGYNLNDNAYTHKMFGGYDVWLSNGVLQIFSKYGIFIGLFFYFCLFKSSKKLINDFGYTGSYAFALTFILISISYDFWSSGIFLYMVLYWFYCLFNPTLSVNYMQILKNKLNRIKCLAH